MIETIVLNHLVTKDTSAGTNVFMETPLENVPQKYILLEKTGSGKSKMLDRATIAVQSISQRSLAEAASLNMEAIEAMESLIENNAVYASDLNSDYNFTNTETKEYRYQAVFDVYYQE